MNKLNAYIRQCESGYLRFLYISYIFQYFLCLCTKQTYSCGKKHVNIHALQEPDVNIYLNVVPVSFFSFIDWGGCLENNGRSHQDIDLDLSNSGLWLKRPR